VAVHYRKYLRRRVFHDYEHQIPRHILLFSYKPPLLYGQTMNVLTMYRHHHEQPQFPSNQGGHLEGSLSDLVTDFMDQEPLNSQNSADLETDSVRDALKLLEGSRDSIFQASLQNSFSNDIKQPTENRTEMNLMEVIDPNERHDQSYADDILADPVSVDILNKFIDSQRSLDFNDSDLSNNDPLGKFLANGSFQPQIQPNPQQQQPFSIPQSDSLPFDFPQQPNPSFRPQKRSSANAISLGYDAHQTNLETVGQRQQPTQQRRGSIGMKRASLTDVSTSFDPLAQEFIQNTNAMEMPAPKRRSISDMSNHQRSSVRSVDQAPFRSSFQRASFQVPQQVIVRNDTDHDDDDDDDDDEDLTAEEMNMIQMTAARVSTRVSMPPVGASGSIRSSMRASQRASFRASFQQPTLREEEDGDEDGDVTAAEMRMIERAARGVEASTAMYNQPPKQQPKPVNAYANDRNDEEDEDLTAEELATINHTAARVSASIPSSGSFHNGNKAKERVSLPPIHIGNHLHNQAPSNTPSKKMMRRQSTGMTVPPNIPEEEQLNEPGMARPRNSIQSVSELSVPSMAHIHLPLTTPSLSASKLSELMIRSSMSQMALQNWDRQNGLPKSHSKTMIKSARSRKQLQEGVILKKWDGSPLLDFNVGASDKKPRRRNSATAKQGKKMSRRMSAPVGGADPVEHITTHHEQAIPFGRRQSELWG